MAIASDERLGSAPLVKLVFSLALPSVVAQLVNLLYSIVDRVYIGHIPEIGALALTGLGLCSPIILLVSAFAVIAGLGGAPLAAMELGRGDREKAGRILTMSFLMLLFFSIVLTISLLIFKLPLLRFFGASDATIPYANEYVTIYLCGTIFVQLALGLNNFISGQGQAKVAMLSVVIGAVANIVLDPIFIFLFGMGVKGAALATIISQGLSAAWVLRFLVSERSIIRIRREFMRPNFSIIGRITSLGISPFIMQSTECLISIVFTNGLSRYGGDLYVGTFTVLQSVNQLLFIPSHGFTAGAQPIISYCFGAGKNERVKQCYRIMVAVTLSVSLLFYLFVFFFPELLAGMYTSDAALLQLSAEKLPIFMFGMSISGLLLSAQTSLLGMGQAKVSLFIACLRKIVLLTPLALVLPRIGLGVDGIYLAVPISDLVSSISATILFYMISRKLLRKDNTTKETEE